MQQILVSNFLPRLREVKGHCTYVKGHLQDILGDLHDAGVSELPWNAHPGVGGGHGVAQLLEGDDDNPVWDHWWNRIRQRQREKRQRRDVS